MPIPENEPSRLDKLQNRLYAKNIPLRKRSRSGLTEEVITGHDTFSPVEPMAPHKKLAPSFFKKVFYGSLIFFGIAILFAGFMWWQGKRTVSSDRITITVLGSSFTEGGEELPLEVEIENKNNVNQKIAKKQNQQSLMHIFQS